MADTEGDFGDDVNEEPDYNNDADDMHTEEDNGSSYYNNKSRPMFRGRRGFRGRGRGGPFDFGPRGPPPPPPRFRGRGFPPRGPPPPPFRGPPPPFGPRGRFRGPPPHFDPNWGPMPGPPGMHGGPPPGMMGGPGGMHPNAHMGGPPMGEGGPRGGMHGPPNNFNPNQKHHPSNNNEGQNSNEGPPNNQPPGGGGGGGALSTVDLSGEIWVETKTGEGKSYFYNARTRETSWSRPEGNGIKVLSQDQVEAMAQAAGVGQTPTTTASGTNTTTAPQVAVTQAQIQQQPAKDPQGNMEEGGPAKPAGGNMMAPPFSGPPPFGGNPPPGFGMPPPAFAMGGPPQGWGGMGPPGMTPPGMGPPGMGPPGMTQPGMGPPGMTQPGMGQPGMVPPGMGQPGMGPPGMGQPGMAPGMVPPVQQMMPPVTVAPPSFATLSDEPPGTAPIDPQLVMKAAEWTEHKAPDGRSYFYNAKLAQSVWEKPQAMKDLEVARLAAVQSIVTTAPPTQAIIPPNPAIIAAAAATIALEVANKVEEQQKQSEQQQSMNGNEQSQPQPAVDSVEQAKLEEEAKAIAATEKVETEEKAKEQVKVPVVQDKSRPISSTPVPATPWCVVWTGDGRVFFYNPSTRTSVWERPPEIVGRTDVDKMVQGPPNSDGSTSNSIGEKKRTEDKPVTQDEPPYKKIKKEDAADFLMKEDVSTKVTLSDNKKIDLGKEAAMEAEVRAARERASVPLETRVKQFKDMLQEKEVSAFSTWEKELHKIVFDPRYLLLTSKERKQVFERYVKERAEEERREKRNKMKEKRDDFRKMMEESDITGKSSFSDFTQKYSRDDRFKNIDKTRERESLFNEYMIVVRKKEKDEKQLKREQIRRDFFQLLREQTDLDRHSRWNEVKKKMDNDARYKAVESSTLREDWFHDHLKYMKDERKKNKDNKDREKERERERERERDREKRKEREKEHHEREKSSSSRRESKEERNSKEPIPEHESSLISEDQDEEKEREAKEKDKRERVEASLREREKEVHRTLATHLRDRDKEREQHKHDEAAQHFSALLADLVRNSDLSWREAKRTLRKDHRWDSCTSMLERDEREKLFNQHIEALTKKKKEKFRELLDETADLTLVSSWKEVRKQIKEDPRYSKFSSSDKKCEKEYKDYIKDKVIATKADFRELLKETKMITHKSLKLAEENEQHYKEIDEILKKDKRYLILDCMSDERDKMIASYLEDLDKRGPPPPPTASEPTRRSTK